LIYFNLPFSAAQTSFDVLVFSCIVAAATSVRASCRHGGATVSLEVEAGAAAEIRKSIF